MNFLISAIVTFVACMVGIPLLLAFARMLGLYAIVRERQCNVYMLFGKVIDTIDQPGLHILPFKIGPAAFIMNWLGKCHVLDMRLDQEYLRSQPVNSEEGAPMGIGIWHEMFISDPVSYLFKNSDPRGSLSANVSNSAVRCLSNMPLETMMVNRHFMSDSVRNEVSPKSHEWGYKLGSIYIRKVHFRDVGMIRQIESKVVNRLRQVTSAIKQDGANQVSIITSTAERQAAIEFAKASAIRPEIVGAALQEISREPEVTEAMFEILETQKIISSNSKLTILPQGGELLAQLLSGQPSNPTTSSPPLPNLSLSQ
jgi:regulator of protease activity HflC (stomatin/prohibitin superfamily)